MDCAARLHARSQLPTGWKFGQGSTFTFTLRWCTSPTDFTDANGKVVVQGAYLIGPPDDCNDSNAGAFVTETWYEDADNNGCGNPNRSVRSCGQPGCNIRYARTSGAGCI